MERLRIVSGADGRTYCILDGKIVELTFRTTADIDAFNKSMAECTTAEARKALLRSVMVLCRRLD